VFSAVSLADLKQPEALYRKLGAKLVVGMPFKDIATSDSIFMRQVGVLSVISHVSLEPSWRWVAFQMQRQMLMQKLLLCSLDLTYCPLLFSLLIAAARSFRC
jgi:hypothetical protein